MNNGLNARQNTFVKHIAAGNTATKSAVLAGYSKKSARFTASKLLTNSNILQHLEEIFAKAGLSDEQLIHRLKTAIDSGIGKKANNSDAIKGLKMAFELKNRFPSTYLKAEVTQEDEHIMRLKGLTDEELADYLEETTQKTMETLDRLKARRLEHQQQKNDEILQSLPSKGISIAVGKPVQSNT